MIAFFNFEVAASKVSIIYLKRRQFDVKLHREIHDERIRWEERKKQRSKCIREIDFEQ